MTFKLLVFNCIKIKQYSEIHACPAREGPLAPNEPLEMSLVRSVHSLRMFVLLLMTMTLQHPFVISTRITS